MVIDGTDKLPIESYALQSRDNGIPRVGVAIYVDAQQIFLVAIFVEDNGVAKNVIHVINKPRIIVQYICVHSATQYHKRIRANTLDGLGRLDFSCIGEAGAHRHANDAKMHLLERIARGGRGQYLVIAVEEAQVCAEDKR